MQVTSMRARLGILGVLVSVLLLAACGPVPPDESAAARAASDGPVSALTMQLPQPPTSFDPLAATGSANYMLAAAHFQPLVSALDGRIMPRMAEWWGVSDDSRRVMVNIKRDRWSDGERMSAKDLLFTVEAHVGPGSRSPLVPVLLQIEGAREFHEGRAAHVSGLVAETSRTLAIHLTAPDANYLGRLTSLLVLPRHIYGPADLGQPATFREPRVGSGAYLFDSWQGDEQVTLHPNPQVTPFTRLSGVVARTVRPDQALAAMREGSLDVALDVPSRDVDAVPPSHVVLRAPGDRVVGLSPASEKLDDVRVRQALAFAIDREQLLADHLGGNGRVVDSVLFTPDWAESPRRANYQWDVGRATALLADAGWDETDQIRLVVLTQDHDRGVWDAVIANLAEAGVRATIDLRPTAESDSVWEDPAVDGVIETRRLAMPEPSFIEPWVRCDSRSTYCNPALDDLLRTGRVQLVATERQVTYQRIDEILARDLPVIPLWVPDASVAVVKGSAGVSPLLEPATAMIDFWGPA